jgi:hypothetical protein
LRARKRFGSVSFVNHMALQLTIPTQGTMMNALRSLTLVAGLFVFLAPARAAEPKVFFGNLHAHTCDSDGSGKFETKTH